VQEVKARSGGSAAGGQAPQNNMSQIMGLLQDAGLKAAQIDNINAQTDKVETETDKLKGVDTENVKADIANKLTANEGMKLDNALKSGNLETYIETGKEILKQTKLENVSKGVDAKYAEQEKKLSLLSQTLNNGLTKAKTLESGQMTKESKQKIIESENRIKQDWQKVSQGWELLSKEQQKNKIEQFKADTQRDYPAIWNVMGKTMDIMTRAFDEWSTDQLGTERTYK
jgi:hypothetical protein